MKVLTTDNNHQKKAIKNQQQPQSRSKGAILKTMGSESFKKQQQEKN